MYGNTSNSKVTITKSNNTYLAQEYTYTKAKICNSWQMFNCKKLFILQTRPPSLILLITTSQDRWIFPSQRWEVRNSIIIIIIIIIIICIFNWAHRHFIIKDYIKIIKQRKICGWNIINIKYKDKKPHLHMLHKFCTVIILKWQKREIKLFQV